MAEERIRFGDGRSWGEIIIQNIQIFAGDLLKESQIEKVIAQKQGPDNPTAEQHMEIAKAYEKAYGRIVEAITDLKREVKEAVASHLRH